MHPDLFTRSVQERSVGSLRRPVEGGELRQSPISRGLLPRSIRLANIDVCKFAGVIRDEPTKGGLVGLVKPGAAFFDVHVGRIAQTRRTVRLCLQSI